MRGKLVYSPRYDFSLFGVERLHPFDGRKYSRAWGLIEQAVGADLASAWIEPEAPVGVQDLLRVHSADYLERLRSSAVMARALELPLLRFIPGGILQTRLISPMLYATQGTILATAAALDGTDAMNIGGGFHHAFPDRGEGFCLFADVAIAIAVHRSSGLLDGNDQVMVIDLDAHRANGFFAATEGDPAIHLLDLYNAQRYPGLFPGDVESFPFIVPLRAGLGGDAYFDALVEELPPFLDSVPSPRLAIYNAGTDIVAGDPLGGFDVDYDKVAARDRAVIDELARRGIPTVTVTSGGYSAASHRLIADLAVYLATSSTRQELEAAHPAV